MSKSLAGKYTFLSRVFHMGRRIEPGAVVALTHEDAKALVGHKVSTMAGKVVPMIERVDEPEAEETSEPEPKADEQKPEAKAVEKDEPKPATTTSSRPTPTQNQARR